MYFCHCKIHNSVQRKCPSHTQWQRWQDVHIMRNSRSSVIFYLYPVFCHMSHSHYLRFLWKLSSHLLGETQPWPMQLAPAHLSFGAGPAAHPWLTPNCQHLLWPSSPPSIPSFLPKDQPASWKSKPMLTVRNSCLCLPTTRPTYSQILASLVQEGSILLFVFWILLPLISLIFLFLNCLSLSPRFLPRKKQTHQPVPSLT